MSNQKSSSSFTIGSLIGLILCCFFSTIIVYVLVAMDFTDYPAGASVITFVIFNLVSITAVVTFGKAIQRVITTASYIQIVFITALYTLFQFIHMFIFYSTDNVVGYNIYHMCVLFFYLLIISPIALTGAKKEK
ncbi:MAG: hypothetical protein GX286_07220 [Clostridiales bacterium]|nr:hypothetical protein [Clostridiales bacterium]